MNIEELAFKNYYELINIQKIDLLLIIEFLQKDRKQWINQFTQTHNENIDIQKENQELKQKYLNAVADYETTMAEKSELEKRLYELGGVDEFNKHLLTQQKAFIKWLEKKQSSLQDEISELTLGMCNTDVQDTKIEIYEKVLQKYKSIIGVSDENNIK